MPANDLDKVLSDAAGEVLETMFFAAVMGEAPGPGAEPRLAARVAFRGQPSGAVVVSACPVAARSLAAVLSLAHARSVTVAKLSHWHTLFSPVLRTAVRGSLVGRLRGSRQACGRQSRRPVPGSPSCRVATLKRRWRWKRPCNCCRC